MSIINNFLKSASIMYVMSMVLYLCALPVTQPPQKKVILAREAKIKTLIIHDGYDSFP